MRWEIDPPVRAGGWAFAAICEVDVAVRPFEVATIVTAKKTPRLILGMCGDDVVAVDIKGQGYAADAIERLYPTAIVQFRAALSGPSQEPFVN